MRSASFFFLFEGSKKRQEPSGDPFFELIALRAAFPLVAFLRLKRPTSSGLALTEVAMMVEAKRAAKIRRSFEARGTIVGIWGSGGIGQPYLFMIVVTRGVIVAQGRSCCYFLKGEMLKA